MKKIKGFGVTIKTIPHQRQRYATLGDYVYGIKKDRLKTDVLISEELGVWYSLAVAIHELCEIVLCAKKGVKEQDITDFDMAFTGPGEPGDDPKAPYFNEHQVATIVEKAVIKALGGVWQVYDDRCLAVCPDEGSWTPAKRKRALKGK